VNPGSIFNIITRLAGTGVVEKTDQGVKFVNQPPAPVIFQDFAWGPPQVFQKYDLAEHRRMVILHLLRASSLQVVQITEYLQDSSICKAPATKDLIKVDLDVLQKAGIVRRVGNSKKWELVKEKNAHE
jgi:hypothetical protein